MDDKMDCTLRHDKHSANTKQRAPKQKHVTFIFFIAR